MRNNRKKDLKKILREHDVEILFESLQEFIDEENETFNSLTDSQQESERGEKIERTIELLQEIIDCLESAIDSVNGLDEHLNLNLWD